MFKNPLITLLATLALACAALIVFQTSGNGKLQENIQGREQEIQTVQSEIQKLNQQLQEQQQRIESAQQLANQAGPAVLNEMASLQLKNNNIALGVLLQKHGVQVRNPQSPAAPQPSKSQKGTN
ncbi:MAG: hypothetical protein ACKOHM_01650 [Spartobacteria bacterium]